jgi:hypothetical protein
MKKTRTNSKVNCVFLAAILAFTTMFVALPIVSAHDPAWEIKTYSYITVTPNLIGVNQPVTILFWPNVVPATAVGAYGDRWKDLTVEITKPDGTKETLGPYTSDPVGGGYTIYTPTQVGTYTFVFKFPQQTLMNQNPSPTGFLFPFAADFIGDTYLGSTSDPALLFVQQDPIDPYPETPLPIDYWERPISALNREWSSIAGNWLNGGTRLEWTNRINYYTTGPESAHIVWTRPYWSGGIMDGKFGAKSYYDGLSYEAFWGWSSNTAGTPIIINGILYYNVLTPPRYGYYAIDLRTGEELWWQNSTGQLLPTAYAGGGTIGSGSYPMLSFGQVLNMENPNQYGGFPYLWSASGVITVATAGAPVSLSAWQMYDAFTGNYICSIANVSSGTQVYGKDGSILLYNVDTAKDRLTCWNTTKTIMAEAITLGGARPGSNYYWIWRPFLEKAFDGNSGYSLNVSIPAALTGSINVVLEDRIIGSSGLGSYTNLYGGYQSPYIIWCLSLKPGQEGQLLWQKEYTTPPFDDITLYFDCADLDSGIFTLRSKETMQIWGYSVDTGNLVWGPTEPQGDFMFYTTNYAPNFPAYGKLFSGGGLFGGGELHAYDLRTGQNLWSYYGGTTGFETYFDNAPTVIGAIADEKIYVFDTEHSPSKPLRRGSYLRCIDATSGEEIWRISHWGNGPAIADGYLVDLNNYDGLIYCYGKGQTETTVTASPEVALLGSRVLVEGMVTDQSPGAKGTPAISDESMTEWMEYLYMQRPCPENAEGVEVVITTFDPNGNTYELGRTTTSLSSTFGCEINPPVPGLYKIIATFKGSDSYYSSYAETYLIVEEAPSPAEIIEPEPTTPNTTESTPTEPTPTELATLKPTGLTEPEPAEATARTPLITTELAIIVVVAVPSIIGIIAFWILRKRK